MQLRRSLAAIAFALLAAVGLVGCGKSHASSAGTTVTTAVTCPKTETGHLAKSKFVLHAGLAAGAFYKFIFQPFRAGRLSFHLHNLASLAEAALAGAFVVHEVDVAKSDAAQDPTLCKVVIKPLDDVYNALASVVHKLKSGGASSTNIDPISSGFDSLHNQASSAGSSFQNTTPSAGQLANPSSTGS